jgi:RNA-directed DNA polymerase
MTAAKSVLEPIFEAQFLPCSFGFRPKRSAHQALEVVRTTANKGVVWVLDADISDCFGSLAFDAIVSEMEKRVSDRKMLKLIRAWLRVGVLEGGVVTDSVTGAPQGGLCAAAHKEPYEQCRVMRSVGPSSLVKAGSGVERCT